MGFVRLMAAILLLCVVAVEVEAQDSPFTETFEVTRTDWYRNAGVIFRLTQCNVSSEAIVVGGAEAGCALPARDVVIRNDVGSVVAEYHVPGPPPFCSPETLPAGKCRVSTLEWNQQSGNILDLQSGEQVPPGAYLAEILVVEGWQSTREFQLHAGPRPIPMLGGVAMTILLAFLMAVGSFYLRPPRV